MTREEAQKEYSTYVKKQKERVRKVVEMIEAHFNIKSSYCDTIAFFPFGNELLVFQLTPEKDKWMVTMHFSNTYVNHRGTDDKTWFDDPVEAFKPAFSFAKKLCQDLAQEIPSVQ